MQRHHAAGRELRLRGRQFHEPVGADQGQEVARVLRRRRARPQRAAGRLQEHRQKQRQRRREPHRLGQRRLLRRRRGRPFGGRQEGHDVAAQAGHHRYRIAGQREHPLAARRAADPQRLAGTLAHAVQVALHAQAREHSRQKVGAALRHRAGGNHHVVAAQGVTHPGGEAVGIIRQMARRRGVAELGQRRGHGVAVGAAHLVGGDRLTHVDQFVAGGDDRHPRARAYCHLAAAHRGQDRHVGGGDAAAGGQHRGAGPGIGALAVHVLARNDRLLRLQPGAGAVQPQVLAADHRVAAGRKHGAGHHPHRAAGGVAQPLARLAGARLALHLQRLTASLQSSRGDSYAIHGHPVVGGQVAVRRHRLAQHPPDRGRQGAPLGGQRHGAGGQELVDVGDGMHGSALFSLLPRSRAGQRKVSDAPMPAVPAAARLAEPAPMRHVR